MTIVEVLVYGILLGMAVIAGCLWLAFRAVEYVVRHANMNRFQPTRPQR